MTLQLLCGRWRLIVCPPSSMFLKYQKGCIPEAVRDLLPELTYPRWCTRFTCGKIYYGQDQQGSPWYCPRSKVLPCRYLLPRVRNPNICQFSENALDKLASESPGLRRFKSIRTHCIVIWGANKTCKNFIHIKQFMDEIICKVLCNSRQIQSDMLINLVEGVAILLPNPILPNSGNIMVVPLYLVWNHVHSVLINETNLWRRLISINIMSKGICK